MEATAGVGIAAIAAQINRLPDALAIPAGVAAERVDSADRIAAGCIIAARIRMGDIAIAPAWALGERA